MKAALIFEGNDLNILWNCVTDALTKKEHSTAYKLQLERLQKKLSLTAEINDEVSVVHDRTKNQSQYNSEDF